MTPAKREAALWLADALNEGYAYAMDEAAALLRELAAEPPVNNDVAWLWTHCKALGMKRKSLSGSMRDDIALYVVDLRELAEPQRTPLTDEQIDKILDRVRMNWASSPPTHEFALAFARAVERDHGIEGAP